MTFLIVILILILLGALPTWGYSSGWGYGPGGIVGTILVIVVILALDVVALVQVVVPMVGAARGWSDWMRVAVPAALVQFLLVAAAFAAAKDTPSRAFAPRRLLSGVPSRSNSV